jgi:transcriptional regulator with XRE-family HTH domain
VNQQSLGLRLRAERERRRITLESIAANTKIGVGLLRALERDDVSRWPGGIFRRAFIRAYAEAVGLDADEILTEFLERFPDPEHPSAAPAAAATPAAVRTPDASLRLTLDASWSPFLGGQVLTRIRERAAAAAVDVGLMLALAVVMFMIVGEFWAPLGITMLCYYVVSIMSLGNTPGVCLLAPRPSSEEAELNFHNLPDRAGVLGDKP